MYQYTEFDRQFVHARAAQFRDQLQRHLAGELAEDDFKALRLQNGWYVQRHAPMLRVAVPYGELSSRQLHQLARIAREFDRDYGHFTTRQNLQFNWIALPRAADVMDLLADVDMHGIQTSGNCIRNITSDALAGIAPDEVVDPRPYCEILRQWSTLHPEFAFLPRKFKIAVTGAREDRAAIGWHDIGLQLLKNDAGEVGFRVLVGGGMGRTPVIGSLIAGFVPWQQILVFIEAIVRVYNRLGRRDNLYKARIKILVKAEGQKFVELPAADDPGEPPHKRMVEVGVEIADRFLLAPFTNHLRYRIYRFLEDLGGLRHVVPLPAHVEEDALPDPVRRLDHGRLGAPVPLIEFVDPQRRIACWGLCHQRNSVRKLVPLLGTAAPSLSMKEALKGPKLKVGLCSR
jgi:dissimilatory sulfite reductase (desulfoviridin) alpha/beta subunit